jgi:broad specificity phosphatase PhoE
MSSLILVRHGKASAFSATDYDQLSEPGFAQSRLLGAYWAARGVEFDAVYIGPRRRHRETHDCVRDAYLAKGLPWPEPTFVDELDEHAGILLLFKVIPILAAQDETLRAIADTMQRGESPTPQQILSVFRTVTRKWARGEVSHDEVESFPAFRARVKRALDLMTSGAKKGSRVVAFTSAGAVAASIGAVLDIGDEKVLDLSWALHNGAVSELFFSDGKWGMRSFNETPHITDPSLITAV